ncbi:uncharacterized protein LOC136737691 [Amia ocellicauda]|uniref:uncharacterized protein LOC136737691 n=1 Tax=Amia ocellicauda TaxID=2972642 RepID=UPI003463987F
MLPQSQDPSGSSWPTGSESCESDKPAEKPAPEPSFHTHLYRLFGREKAEYFLRPQSPHTKTSPWVLRVLEQMGEQVSAEALWRTLREQSHLQLMKMEPLFLQTPLAWNVSSSPARRRRRQQQSGLVGLMYRSAQLSQDHTRLFITSNPLPNLSDPCGEEGPCRFLLQEPALGAGGGPQGLRNRVQECQRGTLKSCAISRSPGRSGLADEADGVDFRTRCSHCKKKGKRQNLSRAGRVSLPPLKVRVQCQLGNREGTEPPQERPRLHIPPLRQPAGP